MIGPSRRALRAQQRAAAARHETTALAGAVVPPAVTAPVPEVPPSPSGTSPGDAPSTATAPTPTPTATPASPVAPTPTTDPGTGAPSLATASAAGPAEPTAPDADRLVEHVDRLRDRVDGLLGLLDDAPASGPGEAGVPAADPTVAAATDPTVAEVESPAPDTGSAPEILQPPSEVAFPDPTVAAATDPTVAEVEVDPVVARVEAGPTSAVPASPSPSPVAELASRGAEPGAEDLDDPWDLSPPTGPATASSLLVARELLQRGMTRDAVRRRLRDGYGVPDPDAVLAAVTDRSPVVA